MTPAEYRKLTFEEHAVMDAYMRAYLERQQGGRRG